MITNLQAFLLGVIQGLTEFLPVSSSGHLVLGQRLLGLGQPELLFDVAVHVGTLLAVVVFFRRDLYLMLKGLRPGDGEAKAGRRLLWLVIAGSVPTALMGFLLKDSFERMFGSVFAVGVALILTGVFLALTRLAPAGTRGIGRMGTGRALLVGLAQGLAITPGISRSGATISAGLFLGLERDLAARFSFVLSIPAILGALLLQVSEIEPGASLALSPLLIGALSAALVGYLALKLLIRLLEKGRLHWFAPYCWGLGVLALIWSLAL